MNFREYPPKTWEEILPGVEGETRDLVGALVRYSGGQRLTAEEALKHPFFSDVGGQ